jgi:hypothetical protein
MVKPLAHDPAELREFGSNSFLSLSNLLLAMDFGIASDLISVYKSIYIHTRNYMHLDTMCFTNVGRKHVGLMFYAIWL